MCDKIEEKDVVDAFIGLAAVIFNKVRIKVDEVYKSIWKSSEFESKVEEHSRYYLIN